MSSVVSISDGFGSNAGSLTAKSIQETVLKENQSDQNNAILPPPPPSFEPPSKESSADLEHEIIQDSGAVEESGAGKSYSRKRKSLGLLCENFINGFCNSTETKPVISLNYSAKQLGVERRRVYDVVNVLECLDIVHRKAKNEYIWEGLEPIHGALREVCTDSEAQNLVVRLNEILSARNVVASLTDMNSSDWSLFDRLGVVPSAANAVKNVEDSVESNVARSIEAGPKLTPSKADCRVSPMDSVTRGHTPVQTPVRAAGLLASLINMPPPSPATAQAVQEAADLVQDGAPVHSRVVGTRKLKFPVSSEIDVEESVVEGKRNSIGGSEVRSRRDKSLGKLCRMFLTFFMSMPREMPLSLEEAARATVSRENSESEALVKAKIRRLYDIANIFGSLSLIRKIGVRHKQVFPDVKKPAFVWTGVTDATVDMFNGDRVAQSSAVKRSSEEIGNEFPAKRQAKVVPKSAKETEAIANVLSTLPFAPAPPISSVLANSPIEKEQTVFTSPLDYHPSSAPNSNGFYSNILRDADGATTTTPGTFPAPVTSFGNSGSDNIPFGLLRRQYNNSSDSVNSRDNSNSGGDQSLNVETAVVAMLGLNDDAVMMPTLNSSPDVDSFYSGGSQSLDKSTPSLSL